MIVCAGTSSKAALAQLVNLTSPKEAISARLKTLSHKLLKIKLKRDALAHMVTVGESAKSVRLKFLGASRVDVWSSFVYSIDEIDRWTHKIAKHAREIESLTHEFSGWDSKRYSADQEQWIQSLGARGE